MERDAQAQTAAPRDRRAEADVQVCRDNPDGNDGLGRAKQRGRDRRDDGESQRHVGSRRSELAVYGRAVAGVFLVDLADVQDAAPNDSLATMCLAGLHSAVSGTTWTIRKTDGTTKLAKTVTSSLGAAPIVGVN